MTRSLQVSPDGRSLVAANGRPFFYLADTAWQLFQSLDLDEATHYLQTRERQGFNVIQAVAYPEYGGLDETNKRGDLAMHGGDPGRPNDAYFEHVAEVIEVAEGLGIHFLLLPTWGSHVTRAWAEGPTAQFTVDSAAAYGRWIAERLGGFDSLMWCLGGDRAIPDAATRAIWDAMAWSIRQHEPMRHLMAWHPLGGSSASRWVDDAAWLDVRLVQSGHLRRFHRNWEMIAADAERLPVRPVLDAEPCYEKHPVYFDASNEWFDEHDVRRAAWWSVLSGACGHAYGCHDVWMMADGDRRPVATARGDWRTSLRLPGAEQMRHVRKLAEARLLPGHFNDDALARCESQDSDHIAVARDGEAGKNNASYLVAYTPMRRPDFTIDTRVLGSDAVRWSWWDPRRGRALGGGRGHNTGTLRPTFPQEGADWVLVVDDPAVHAPLEA